MIQICTSRLSRDIFCGGRPLDLLGALHRSVSPASGLDAKPCKFAFELLNLVIKAVNLLHLGNPLRQLVFLDPL